MSFTAGIIIKTSIILDVRTRRRALSRPGVISLAGLTVLAALFLSAIGTDAAAPQRARNANGEAVPNNAATPPQVLESVPPRYTDEAVLAKIEGTVTLEVEVDIDSKVRVLNVVRGLGHGLDQSAIDAVLGWKFGP